MKNNMQNPSALYTFGKRDKRKKTGLYYAIVFIVLVVLIVLAVWFVLFCGCWKVKTISVNGTRLINDSTVISASSAQIHLKSGVFGVLGSDNILFWKFGSKYISLSEIPEVDGVSFEIDVLKRSVSINISERFLSAVVCDNENYECYAIDKSGLIFARVPFAEGILIPRFERAKDDNLIIGGRYFKNADWLSNILETLRAIGVKNFVPDKIIIKGDSFEEWEAHIPSGPVFYFNMTFVPNNFDGIMQNIANRIDISSITYFDFRVQDRIYYK